MFKLGISFRSGDFNLLSRVSDKVIVKSDTVNNNKKCIYALESDIPEEVLKDIKSQLLSICNNPLYISRYSHINQIYDFSIIPLITYIEAIERLKKIHQEDIEIILPANFYFQSKNLRLFLAEGEKRFSFMYNRGEAYSYFIKKYCIANGIKYTFIKKRAFLPPFSGYIRRKVIFFGKLMEDLTISLNKSLTRKNFLKNKKDLILHRASPSKLYLQKQYNNERTCCVLVESSALPSKALKAVCNDEESIYRMPHPGLMSVLMSYMKNYPKSSYDHFIDIYGIQISLQGVLKELEIMNPNLDIYKKRLALLQIKNIVNVFSTQQKSPQAALEFLFFSDKEKSIYFSQIVDVNTRVTPKFIFGGVFIPYFTFLGKLVVENNPEIKITDYPNPNHNLQNLEYKKDGSIVFFNTEMSKKSSSKLIQSKIIRFAEDQKSEFIKYKHPRDPNIDDISPHMDIETKIKDARIIFTYPSAIIFELIKYNIPIIVLFIGVGKNSKWHYSYQKDYDGCIDNIDDISTINLETIQSHYTIYRKNYISNTDFILEE